jgi:chorismate synthase
MNSFGHLFRVTTFGESHGPAIGCVIDGAPPGLEIDVDAIHAALGRRATGKSRYVSQRKESDQVEFVSGLFEGVTTGMPITAIIRNTDARSKDYSKIAAQFRPGHADFTYWRKYGIRDYRGGGRSSARETTVRVVAGEIARQYLQQHLDLRIHAWVSAVGDLNFEPVEVEAAAENPFYCPDPSRLDELEAFMKALWKSGDSIGARVNLRVQGVPVGLGEPVYGKLDTDLAAAMMSINAVKGVELGAGFDSVAQRGTEHRDEIRAGEGFLSNHAGGVLGGISTGQDLLLSMAFKPTSSLRLSGESIDRKGQAVEIVTTGRHDPCVGLRAPPIAEAMAACVLLDHWLRHRAQNGDVSDPGPRLPGEPEAG